MPLVTPLHAAHLKMGARMVEFAGYDMPVQYSSIIAEAKAVREGAGMFDVSHMARLTFTGTATLAYLQSCTTNDVDKLEDGHGQYSILPNAQGGAVDDIIVYRVSTAEYRLVVNADNHAKDVAHFRSLLPAAVEMIDNTDQTAMVAVQGPTAAAIVASLSDNATAVRDIPFFSILDVQVAGVPCFAARSGYTGEDGYELVCSAQDAEKLWWALSEAGVAACGLGSRDTLRVEAGLPLYGHELSDDMSPLWAGLGWVISKTKDFVGSQHYAAEREAGIRKKLLGIKMDGRRIPPIGAEVTVDGSVAGTVTSGVFSPMLGCGIGFALVGSTYKVDTPCAVDVRGQQETGCFVNKRFFKRA
ncbi:MAG: glycine cleavage system aminomethyltransferase GcvT [Armatimonadetes bacterium]|nr:glycine cleavage system aminomethyltransferase GcvT [Armatimonadota bacterium]